MFISEVLINLIAPHRCLGCNKEGLVICIWCLPLLEESIPSRCFRCHQLTHEYAVCKKCKPKSNLRHVWVTSEYSGLAKKLVRAYKYERVKAAVTPVATLMTQTLPYLPSHHVQHIPTATSRRRQRGYDQAELLAQDLARALKMNKIDSLLRTGQTRQVGASRDTRLKQLEYAFIVPRSEMVKGKEILLVDDITTTGATLIAAAKALKQAGAISVSAVVFAQKQ